MGSPQALAALNSIDVNDTLAATTYSRACYGTAQNALQCTQYPQSQLSWEVNQNATCPFSQDLCFYGASSAYEMDTGLIDSHVALGINAPKSERVQYRKVTTCKRVLNLQCLASTVPEPEAAFQDQTVFRKPFIMYFISEENTLIRGLLGSPIHTRGYATEINDTDPTQLAYGDLLQQFWYGPTGTNYTYQYNPISTTEDIGYMLMYVVLLRRAHAP